MKNAEVVTLLWNDAPTFGSTELAAGGPNATSEP